MKEQFVELVKVWKEDSIGNIVIIVITFASSILNQILRNGIEVFNFADGFLLNIAPTIGGGIMAFALSNKPLKERWKLLLASGIFNAWLLDFLLLYFNKQPNVGWYCIGGFSAYYIFYIVTMVFGEVEKILRSVLSNLSPSLSKYIDDKLGVKNEKSTYQTLDDEEGSGTPNQLPPKPKGE